LGTVLVLNPEPTSTESPMMVIGPRGPVLV
jgi:hypothetical protein